MLPLVDEAKISSRGRETEIYIQRRKASNVMYIPKQTAGIKRTIKIESCLLRAKIHKVSQGIKKTKIGTQGIIFKQSNSPSTSNQRRKIKTKTKLTRVKGKFWSWRGVERFDLSNAMVAARQG